MLQKILILLLMAPLLAAAWAAGASVPILFLMGSLLLIALASSPVREEMDE